MFKKDASGQPILGSFYDNREEMAKDMVQVAPAVAAMVNKEFAYMDTLWKFAIYTVNKPSEVENKLYIDETLKQRNLIDVDWALACFNMSDEHNGYTMGDGSIHLINIPVLSFHGDKDLVVLQNMVTDTAEAIGGNAEVVLLKDSGHSPLIDHPDSLAERIYGFALDH